MEIITIKELNNLYIAHAIKKMSPYKSQAQERYFHANKKKLEKQGVNVSEWDRASKGKKLPKKVKKKKA